MRVLFLLLLVANVVFFAWMNLYEPKRVAEVDPLLEVQGVEEALPVVLLSEVRDYAADASAPGTNHSGSMLGGFASEAEAGMLRQRLLTLNIDGDVVERVIEINPEYMVFMPAGESKRLALRKIDELHVNGFNAVYVDKGVLDNIILLDVLAGKEAADSLLQRLAGQGYAAEVLRTAKKQQSFWVSISPNSQRLIDSQVISALARDFPGLEHTE